MRVSGYLIFTRAAFKRAQTSPPALQPGEYAIKLHVDVPESIVPEASVTVTKAQHVAKAHVEVSEP